MHGISAAGSPGRLGLHSLVVMEEVALDAAAAAVEAGMVETVLVARPHAHAEQLALG